MKWQDGKDFTSADVVATMDRLVAAGNSGIKGVLDKGSAVATDPLTVTMNLVSANGNFPYLVSVFNAQSLITPADYVAGTTLDKKPNGTGAWKLVEGSYDVASGVKFVRNDTWWGAKTPLDGTEFTFFDDTASMVTAYQGGQIDALVQFDVLSGPRSSTTRTSPSSIRRRPTTARSGCTGHGPVHGPEGPAGVRPVRSIDRRSSSSCSKARACRPMIT